MRILITAGPTREHLDSVRFLTNASTGKMGFAIAAAAAGRGHKVVLIAGPVELPDPAGVRVIRVVSAREMLAAALSQFRTADAAILTAAVCDYRPIGRAARKVKKRLGGLSVRLVATTDIAERLGRTKGRRVVVGFALEDHAHHEHAEGKLRRKRCNAIVMNDAATLGADRAQVQFFRAGDGWGRPIAGTKPQIAVNVVELVESLVPGHATPRVDSVGRRPHGTPSRRAAGERQP